MQRLRPYEFTKTELLMIFNLRPTSLATLNLIVEEFQLRVPSDEEQEAIVDIITQIIGPVEGDAAPAMENGAQDGQ